MTHRTTHPIRTVHHQRWRFARQNWSWSWNWSWNWNSD
jgi:hypothetical protein